ncbi:MAG TPA: SAM-dependent DNA methyltransferase, partial [Arcobacter sp.]|nr:SAM-dependent DNA methyltransferase [Arcobacter sp.]
VIISNPPFSVNINETKEEVNKYFLFGDKKNSENLFLERYYQLLKEGGRLGVVLPESVFDTTENKYIRLFLFKYFKIKAVVSLPQITFEPFTSTKTSILIAQKKTTEEVELWNDLWLKYGNEWSLLKTRCNNLVDVYLNKKDRNRLSSIKSLTPKEEKEILERFLKDYIKKEDKKLKINELLIKYTDEIKELSKMEKDTEVFGFYNAWWVFGEVTKEINIDYDIFMAEAQNVGYKRTKRGESPMPNDLFDLEYAPNKLSIENIKKHYDDLINSTTKNISTLKNDKEELDKKIEEKSTPALLKKQKLLNDTIKQSSEKLEKQNDEYKNTLEIYNLYYEKDTLKNKHYDRTDNKLIKYFKSGIMKRWSSSDIVLRKNEEIKILDSLRMSVKWD